MLLHNAEGATDRILRRGQVLTTDPDKAKWLISKYTAAFAINFTDWMGKTLPWVRHELARYALTDNLRCEATEDHVGMLIEFAKDCEAFPDTGNYLDTAHAVSMVRDLLKDPRTAGLAGLTMMTLLEHTSAKFIPVLERMATLCGSTNLRYTQVHGEADKKHSEAFTNALAAEWGMGYTEEEIGETSQKCYAAFQALLEVTFTQETSIVEP